MTAPNMAAIAASLERSLQNCSLNNHHHHHYHQYSSNSSSSSSGLGFGSSASSDSPPPPAAADDAILELNSHISLPYHWEQCLDLKTGEVYYINWRTGMKAKEDPRISNEYSGEYYSEEDDSSYGSDDEGSSTESSPSSSSSKFQNKIQQTKTKDERVKKEETGGGGVLVVAGCKSCLMYVMVPKQLQDCPKCAGQLLHFDRSDDNSSLSS